MTIHIFNPEHDHALASTVAGFTPPHAARQLRSDLSFLPALWAEDGDIVLVDDVAAATNAYRKLKLCRRSEVVFATVEGLRRMGVDGKNEAVMPWGWDSAIRKSLLKAGIAEEALPTIETLDVIRSLSNRSLAVHLLARLSHCPIAVGHSQICRTYEDVLQFLDMHRDIVIKAPWSCSGRGVRYVTADNISQNTMQWVRNTIHRQSSVVAEVKCSKVADFAVEFQACPDGAVKAVGLSLFTTVNGAYTGNMLDTEENKRNIIGRYIPLRELDDVVKEIEEFLSSRIDGIYTGPLGVDMMIVAGEKSCNDGIQPPFLLNPCVEINMRHTMGHIALALSGRGHYGTMDIVFENKSYKMKLS